MRPFPSKYLMAGVRAASLCAAGETTGHVYRTAPNAVSVLRALVFGKIAGRQAVDFLARR